MTTRTEPAGTVGLYRLLAWLSPSFPIGAFSYSHGLEAAADDGRVHDRASLQNWIAAIVVHGSGRMDADILCRAYRAAAADDGPGLDEANQTGVVYRPTAELALESNQQGAAFLATRRAAWPSAPHPNPLPAGGEREFVGARPNAAHPTSNSGSSSQSKEPSPPLGGRGQGEGGKLGARGRPLTPALSVPKGGEGVVWSYEVCLAAVFGAAAAEAGIALDDALLGYLQAFAGNLVSAGLRLGVIGQTDGQRILAALEAVVTAAASAAMARQPEDFGGATFSLDLASMAHETQYSRLFRS